MEEDYEKGILLGFLSLFETSHKDGMIGAILITDQNGVPQEFRCTHPIRATAIQKPLYGNTLEPYIGIQLSGVPLLHSIQLEPSLIIVNKDFLLNVRDESPCPVIFLYRAGEAIEVGSPGPTTSPLKRDRIESSAGRFQPVVVRAHPNYDEDRDPAIKIIEQIFSHLDPCEPFERMEKAIEVLGKQDDRFK